jgi:hypothetical protein
MAELPKEMPLASSAFFMGNEGGENLVGRKRDEPELEIGLNSPPEGSIKKADHIVNL